MQNTMNTETQQTTSNETTTTWRTLTPTLWRIYIIYLLVWLPSIIFTGYAMREERSDIIGWGLLGLGISVVIYIVCMVFAGRIQGSLHREGLLKSGVAPIVIAALVLNPIFGGFYVPLSVLLSARKAARVASLLLLCALTVGICGCSGQSSESAESKPAVKQSLTKLGFKFVGDTRGTYVGMGGQSKETRFSRIWFNDPAGKEDEQLDEKELVQSELMNLFCGDTKIELASPCTIYPGKTVKTLKYGDLNIVRATNRYELHGTTAQQKALEAALASSKQSSK
jgi:hypothetical protein